MTFTGDIRNITDDILFDNFNTNQKVFKKNVTFPANQSSVSDLCK